MKSALHSLLAFTLVACAAQEAAPESPSASNYEGEPRFSAPAGWTEEAPANAMRLVQYQVPGDQELTCIVSSWPNGVGSLEANLDRWASQVGLDSAADLEAPQRVERVVRGHTVTTLHVEGPLAAGISGGEALEHGAVLAAYVQAADGPAAWTIKLQGPAQQVAAQRGAFDALVSGL